MILIKSIKSMQHKETFGCEFLMKLWYLLISIDKVSES